MKILKATWESPSNIALVKYWGKKGNQLPLNPSFSMCLTNSKTITSVEAIESKSFGIDFYFEGQENLKFKDKIEKKIYELENELPWIFNFKLIIRSQNTFPHSTGIASSASSMSALFLCLVDIESQLNGTIIDLNRVSKLSRIGSGSASRSVMGPLSHWGKNEVFTSSSDDYATIFTPDKDSFLTDLHDAIMIVESTEKSVSSTVGHSLMNNHRHFESRIKNANKNFKDLISAILENAFGAFSRVCENEALDLHAMMMTSDPSFILLKPNSIKIIELIRTWQKDLNLEITFTIDAGPNIHVLYTNKDKEKVEQLLRVHILKEKICHEIIFDKIGKGPNKLL